MVAERFVNFWSYNRNCNRDIKSVNVGMSNKKLMYIFLFSYKVIDKYITINTGKLRVSFFG